MKSGNLNTNNFWNTRRNMGTAMSRRTSRLEYCSRINTMHISTWKWEESRRWPRNDSWHWSKSERFQMTSGKKIDPFGMADPTLLIAAYWRQLSGPEYAGGRRYYRPLRRKGTASILFKLVLDKQNTIVEVFYWKIERARLPNRGFQQSIRSSRAFGY